jgi:signal transduction histidine kinase
VISLVLLVVTLALLFFLVRNPRLTRDAENNLFLAANALQRQRVEINSDSNFTNIVQRADDLLDVRVLIFNAQGELLADSRAETEAAFPNLQHLQAQDRPNEISQITDSNNQNWLYASRNYQSRQTLVVATQRPTQPILSILSDEFFLPIIRAGALALLLSILLSYLVARWIADPLQGITNASQEVGKGKMSQIEPSGPREVQSLARSFNEMSRQLNASQESQRDFVSNVSHELKTPLTSVQGFAQAIMDGTVQSGESLQQAGKVIYNEADRMHRLVVDLLELARLDSGTAKLDYSPVDLAELLRAVIDRFTPQAKSAEVDLKMEKLEIPQILGDNDRLAQVFNNLVENAIKFTSEGGAVKVDASASDKFIDVTVSDTGEGLSKEEADRIFERFYQADKSRRAGRGVGLGLPIARQIAQSHGGDITVESVLAKGSRFKVRLPLKARKIGRSI